MSGAETPRKSKWIQPLNQASVLTVSRVSLAVPVLRLE